jgi:hypothetical protein
LSLTIEWERMRLALAAHVQAGKALKHVSDKSGVARATLLEWLSRGTPPETVAKGAAVMEALGDADREATEG